MKKKAMFSLGPGVDEEEEEEDDDDMARRVESASAALMFGAALSARAGTAPNLGSFAPTSDGKSHVAGDADDDSWVVIDRDTYETIKKRQREFAIESTSSWQESTRRVQKQRSGTIARVE
jgi:ATP-dependent phosphoenolpyruvate carboxykinase